MSDIDRYDLQISSDDTGVTVTKVTCDNGQWVKYEDHLKAMLEKVDRHVTIIQALMEDKS